MKVRHLVILALLGAHPLLAGDTGIAEEPWNQAQLNETFMRSLTKDQCMLKSIRTLRESCTTKQCLSTIAGVMGDCGEWAKGDIRKFCASIDAKYFAPFCGSSDPNEPACRLIAVYRQVGCTKRGM